MKFSTIFAGLVTLFSLAAVSAAPGLFESMADTMKGAMDKNPFKDAAAMGMEQLDKNPFKDAATMGMDQLARKLQNKNDWRDLLIGYAEEVSNKMKDVPADAQREFEEFKENMSSMQKEDAMKKYGELVNKMKNN